MFFEAGRVLNKTLFSGATEIGVRAVNGAEVTGNDLFESFFHGP